MGLNSVYLSVAVFGKTKKEAEKFLIQLVNNMKFGDVESVIQASRTEVILKNGSRYIALTASDCSRGYRFEKAYVQKGIDQELLNFIIRPYFSGEENIEYFD
jgi:hypothetical protein